jgi:hypothetical protein
MSLEEMLRERLVILGRLAHVNPRSTEHTDLTCAYIAIQSSLIQVLLDNIKDTLLTIESERQAQLN